MSRSPDHVIVTRTSPDIATAINNEFGSGLFNSHGNPLIRGEGRVIQSWVAGHRDGEATAALFVDGKISDHPIEQHLTQTEKRRIAKDLKGSDLALVLATSGINSSTRALSALFLANSLKEKYRVRRIRLITTALAFMRSDREFRKTIDGHIEYEFNAVACEHFARLLRFSGVDEIVGFEPHSRDAVRHYNKAMGKKNSHFVNMGDFFADVIRSEYPLVDGQGNPLIMVGSPDGMNKPNDFGIARALSFGEALYRETELNRFRKNKGFRDRPYMFALHKDRVSPTETKIVDFYGDVRGKICILIDDIVSSGSTMLKAAKYLKEQGAIAVIGIGTHGVVPDNSLDEILDNPYLDRLMLTDTVPGLIDKIGNEPRPKLLIKTVAPLVLDAIAR